MKEDNADNQVLKKALNGDIKAFQELFLEFQPQLKSFLYRLLTDRNDVEDISQDTFVKAFDKISTFKAASSLKTWVFQIATNLAYDMLRKYERWKPNAQDDSKALAIERRDIQDAFHEVHSHAIQGRYEIKEHIDFCFTCVSKTLTIEQQIALILKDIYGFERKSIATILDKTEGVVKHLLFEGRKVMVDVFDSRCALVNKDGVCHQCTELNGYFNPKQNAREELMKIHMVREAGGKSKRDLYQLRSALVAHIDPIRSEGAELQDIIMQCTREAIGEIQSLN